MASPLTIVTIVGARPQFIKAAPISKTLRNAGHRELLVHTGQHYDYAMSDVFFDELRMPEPDVKLSVGSGTHAEQTAAMLLGIEGVLTANKPDRVLVYGDTNSTLAGSLAASKMHVPIAHVEAGLRSFNRAMPEEINRVLTDHLSTLLFCPSGTAVKNLANEGIRAGVHLVGDIMQEVLLLTKDHARIRSRILDTLGLREKHYLLATVHRAENTDDVRRLRQILTAFSEINEPVLFPVHPRTRKVMEEFGFATGPNVRLIDPVGYLDMVVLEQSARLILTDSGGIQKEAYWLGVPCITLREETEWIETVETGWNVLAGFETATIVNFAKSLLPPASRPTLYGCGDVSTRCVLLLESGVP
ncbi:MAG TPA: UDP-N-acetylglucosamine 2-epimerase (non-hydrolyzing) [Syntrophales bacterium]|jgi:UDP-N-acetylglucosamine 2-epimerase|nr:UDP-N-acetylglucosamine 2-epimerase (non-hydrolyzing) [Syntrophales bacterium]